MTLNTSTQSKPADVFKTFPEFSKLTVKDRDAFNRVFADAPPIAHLTFPTLMIWWNFLDTCAVAELNGNVVISYWFPGEEKFSGLSVYGDQDIDETLCAIFDRLREQNEPVKLIHVPEDVIRHIKYPEMFICQEERAFDEYIFDLARFYPITKNLSFRRARIQKFVQQHLDQQVEVRSLDMSKKANVALMQKTAATLQKMWYKNNIFKLEQEAIQVAIEHAHDLGLDNLCVFIDGRLEAFFLYQFPASDQEYAIIHHARVNSKQPYLIDYMIHELAKHFSEQGKKYVNLESDFNVKFIRMFKVALGPSNYFRKYTIRPAEVRPDEG